MQLIMYRFNYCQNLPDFYNDYFKQNNELHNYNMRNSTKLHVSYKRTNYHKYTVFNKGVSIWNCIGSNSPPRYQMPHHMEDLERQIPYSLEKT
jgi:hypothetical protein